MDGLAPEGPVYQAGTLSANPLSMVSGLANLQLLTESSYERLEKLSERTVEIFTPWAQKFGITLTRYGSLFWPSHPEGPQGFTYFYKDLLERGIYLPPAPFEVSFVSLAHHEEVLQELERRLS